MSSLDDLEVIFESLEDVGVVYFGFGSRALSCNLCRWSVWRMGEWLGLRKEASALPLRKALFRSTI